MQNDTHKCHAEINSAYDFIVKYSPQSLHIMLMEQQWKILLLSMVCVPWQNIKSAMYSCSGSTSTPPPPMINHLTRMFLFFYLQTDITSLTRSWICFRCAGDNCFKVTPLPHTFASMAATFKICWNVLHNKYSMHTSISARVKARLLKVCTKIDGDCI